MTSHMQVGLQQITFHLLDRNRFVLCVNCQTLTLYDFSNDFDSLHAGLTGIVYENTRYNYTDYKVM